MPKGKYSAPIIFMVLVRGTVINNPVAEPRLRMSPLLLWAERGRGMDYKPLSLVESFTGLDGKKVVVFKPTAGFTGPYSTIYKIE